MTNLVALDLDGTLLNSKKQISNKNIETIKHYHKKGVTFAICTGRSLSAVHFIENIDSLIPYIDYIIYTNGAHCVDRYENTIFDYPISFDDLKTIHSKLNHMDMMLEVFSDGKVYCSENLIYDYKKYITPDFHSLFENTRNMVANIIDFSQNIKTIQMLFISFLQEDDRYEAYQTVKDLDYSISFAGKKGIEFNAKDVHKGKGISSLAKHLGIEKSNIISIGDNHNDLGMRESSKTLVSMENAIQDLKDISDFITKSNDDDGVHYALTQILQ